MSGGCTVCCVDCTTSGIRRQDFPNRCLWCSNYVLAMLIGSLDNVSPAKEAGVIEYTTQTRPRKQRILGNGRSSAACLLLSVRSSHPGPPVHQRMEFGSSAWPALHGENENWHCAQLGLHSTAASRPPRSPSGLVQPDNGTQYPAASGYNAHFETRDAGRSRAAWLPRVSHPKGRNRSRGHTRVSRCILRYFSSDIRNILDCEMIPSDAKKLSLGSSNMYVIDYTPDIRPFLSVTGTGHIGTPEMVHNIGTYVTCVLCRCREEQRY